MRSNPKASPIPAGYVRRTGPTSCSAMPYRGMSVEDFQKIRICALLYAGVLPSKVDVSLGLWGEFIENNIQHTGRATDYTTAAGEHLSPKDAADYLQAMQRLYAPNTHFNAITY